MKESQKIGLFAPSYKKSFQRLLTVKLNSELPKGLLCVSSFAVTWITIVVIDFISFGCGSSLNKDKRKSRTSHQHWHKKIFLPKLKSGQTSWWKKQEDFQYVPPYQMCLEFLTIEKEKKLLWNKLKLDSPNNLG